MQPLEKSLRNNLEKTIKDARDIAEDAARAALEQMGVGEPTAYPHLTEDDRKLRRKLRAHGRQLGNGRDAKGRQELDRLIEEVAYEHWHRMLFARFLAENNLLMYPDPDGPVAVTLEECEDLAADEGSKNGWELASRFAALMLPQIFRPDSPVFQLELPPEHQQKLERLVADLSKEVFKASDSLGWVYQFWQAKKKDEINASEVKIGARELPAVTQLFTEPYMVSFLLDNSLGAWWAARRLSEVDLKNATSEEELRNKSTIPGLPLKYLRFVQQQDGSWTPAAGTFDNWPEHLIDFKILDPCCGSGHFMVAAFLMLVPMRMELEGLTARTAVARVLSENIHGLELDLRCVKLAAFALALAAWRYKDAGGFRPLPELNVACSGLAISADKEDWLSLAGENSNLSIVLDDLYEQFKNAPVLGSLIDPEIIQSKGTLFGLKLEEIGQLLSQALSMEIGDEKTEIGVVAQGIFQAANMLSDRYHLIVTNPPYLTRNKQSENLRTFIDSYYKRAKNDLANVFLERCLALSANYGVVQFVIPQNWLFLVSYKKHRRFLLKNTIWSSLGRLGMAAFEIMDWWAFNVILLTLVRSIPNENHHFFGIDVGSPKKPDKKAKELIEKSLVILNQQQQINNPDSIVSIDNLGTGKLLAEYADSLQGLATGDDSRLSRTFWEVTKLLSPRWIGYQSTPYGDWYSGKQKILLWENGEGYLANSPQARVQGLQSWNRVGIAVKMMGDLRPAILCNSAFDMNVTCLLPKNEDHLPAIWSYVSSKDFLKDIRKINQKVNVSNASFLKVVFDFDHWQKIAKKKFPNGLPKPHSNDPTQWIFHGYPSISNDPLQVAVARLLGYRWPVELDSAIELSDEARFWVKKSESLMPHADDDGIVCIPPVRGEMKAEDRLENLLAAAYGSEWSSDKKAELLSQVGHSDRTLDTWLRDKFFTQHCELFHHRPFIWHIWDGLNDGFAALVNYQKLDAKLLETLIYTYLGDWISRQRQDIGNAVDGAQEKLAAAETLKKKLELILEGEEPYDIFVRWKPIEKQPIGWNPDLNDGVRLNIRPFMTVGDIKKRGAGILRDKPNIKWTKDRGKDVQSASWFHLFKGDRINDHHLSLSEKLSARRVIG